jgi:hypothetical protein
MGGGVIEREDAGGGCLEVEVRGGGVEMEVAANERFTSARETCKSNKLGMGGRGVIVDKGVGVEGEFEAERRSPWASRGRGNVPFMWAVPPLFRRGTVTKSLSKSVNPLSVISSLSKTVISLSDRIEG